MANYAPVYSVPPSDISACSVGRTRHSCTAVPENAITRDALDGHVCETLFRIGHIRAASNGLAGELRECAHLDSAGTQTPIHTLDNGNSSKNCAALYGVAAVTDSTHCNHIYHT